MYDLTTSLLKKLPWNQQNPYIGKDWVGQEPVRIKVIKEIFLSLRCMDANKVLPRDFTCKMVSQKLCLHYLQDTLTYSPDGNHVPRGIHSLEALHPLLKIGIRFRQRSVRA